MLVTVVRGIQIQSREIHSIPIATWLIPSGGFHFPFPWIGGLVTGFDQLEVGEVGL